MNCEDLMNMKQIRNGLKLVAGEKGVDRNIRWIYFADCVQCLDEDFNLAELIHGEELVIVTNESLTDNDDKIINMIEVMAGKNIAAFVINEGQISQRVMDYCNKIELPLYELSVKLHLIDLSQIICRALVEEESNTNSRERILSSILYSDNLNADEIVDQANYLGVNLSKKHRIVVLHIDSSNETKNKNRQADDGFLMERGDNIKKIIKSEFRSYGLRKLMVGIQAKYAVILLPFEFFSKDLLITILENIIQKIESNYNLSIQLGVGMGYEYLTDFKKSYTEAKNAIIISKIMPGKQKVYFYEDLGIYSIITQITNGKFLDDYVENKIGRLIKADQMQEGELCITLETYLEHNCNANAAAEELFIHRNTMRYRMDKIKKILESDIGDISASLDLKLAFAIKRYRECRDDF